MDQYKKLIAASSRLAQTEVESPELPEVVQQLAEAVELLVENVAPTVEEPTGEPAEGPAEEEPSQGGSQQIAAIHEKIDRMHAAASGPAQNYQRIISILGGLKRAALAADRPMNSKVRGQLDVVVNKIAGLFAEVDTVQDLDKPLAEIEKAVHSLYGNLSQNSTYYFDRRNKGHHTK